MSLRVNTRACLTRLRITSALIAVPQAIFPGT
jgi:hypothetical protein